jgi:hypothetical protein
MSTMRGIHFISEKNNPVIQTIQRVIKDSCHKNYKPCTVKAGQFKGIPASTMYLDGTVFENGASLEYFDPNEEVYFPSRPEHANLRLWADVSSANTTYGKYRSFYNYEMFYKILRAIKKEHKKNDVVLLCTTDCGGWTHKSYPKFRKDWNGRFFK